MDYLTGWMIVLLVQRMDPSLGLMGDFLFPNSKWSPNQYLTKYRTSHSVIQSQTGRRSFSLLRNQCPLSQWLGNFIGYDDDDDVVGHGDCLNMSFISNNQLGQGRVPRAHRSAKCELWPSFYSNRSIVSGLRLLLFFLSHFLSCCCCCWSRYYFMSKRGCCSTPLKSS